MGVTTNDSDLLDRYGKCGDEAAFRELVRRHLNLVYSSASRRVGDGHLAEDVTQAVFMILTQKANAARRVTPLSRWLLATVRYAAANALKLDRRRRHHESAAAASRAAGACSPNPSDVLVWQEVATELDDAVLKLSAADRTAVLLRFFEQKPISAVAQALDTTEAAAGMRVTRAVDKLRERLSRRGIASVSCGTAGFTALVSAHAVRPAPPKVLTSVSAAAVGGAASGAASAAIAQGAISMMAWTKISTTAALVAATAILGTVAVVTTNNGFAQGQNSPAGATARAAGAVESNRMQSTLYTSPYKAEDHDVYQLPAHVRWRVLPRYLGIGGDGRRITDERITVVLEDSPNRFWPVIVKMSTADAENLQRELARIIAEKKSAEGKDGRDQTRISAQVTLPHPDQRSRPPATQPHNPGIGAGAGDVSVPMDANEGAAPATQPRRGRTSAPALSGFPGAAAEQELPLNETERELVGRYVEVSRFPVAWTFSADRRYEVTTLGEVVERGQWHVSDHRELVRVIEEDNNVPDRVGTVDVRRIQNLSDSGLRVQVLRDGVEGNQLSYKRVGNAATTAPATGISR